MADREARRQTTPWLEWAVGGLGALLFVGILSVLLSNALQNSSEPPSIHIRVESIQSVRNGYVVQFVAVNEGDQTAAQVRLEAVLQAPEGEVERREVMLDYLPPRSERRGGFVFQTDPGRSQIVITADGYIDP